MIPLEILDFLTKLKANNNRDWYHANKQSFNEAKEKFEFVIDLLIAEISQFDANIKGLSPKDCIFRIYRDVRFSHDKSPYKTNFGAFIAKEGRKSMHAGYYLHIEPQGSFVGGGIYMPPSNILKLLRTEIYQNVDEFKEIILDQKFKSTFGELYGEKLKRHPKDFPPDFPDIDILKHKHYTIFRGVNNEELLKEKFLHTVVDNFKTMHLFNQFLNNAIDKENAL